VGRICADPADKTTTATELCTFGAVDNQMSGVRVPQGVFMRLWPNG
jgi:hypothetical protein